ncbi:MAG: BamA/TamA family outer membrane protein [Microcoleaceae cyanobacterium]
MAVVLAKGGETKPEVLANKQFVSGINTELDSLTETGNSSIVVLAKKGETKPEVLAKKQFATVNNIQENIAPATENSPAVVLAKGGETKREVLANKQFASVNNIQENVSGETEKSELFVLAKRGESKPEVLANKQFASVNNIQENIAPVTGNAESLILATGEETKPEILANKQFNTIISEKKEIVINQKKFTSTLDQSNNLAQMSSPEGEVPEESEEQFTPPSTQPTQPTQPTTGGAEPLVLVAEVVVIGVQGELEDEVYQVISTQPGRTTTRSQLQQDINAIFATGFFQNVKAVPEDTPLGVRVTFEVEPNPVLRSVEVQGSEELPDRVVQDIFGNQYGDILNLKVFEQSVEQLNKWYQDNGYVLAQVIGAPQVSEDGKVILEVAEGEIEDIQVRFVNAEGETTDEEGNPIEGRTREYIITREIELKPGDVFQRQTAEKDIRRVFGLGIFEDVRLGLEPSPDNPNKAVIVVNVVEKSTGSLAFGGGISSASGLFGTVSYQQQNVGGNNQKLGGEFQVGERLLLADLSFTDPWVGGDDHRLSYTVNVFRRRAISVIFDEGERDVDLPDGDNPRVIRTGGGVSFTRPFIPNPFVEPQWTASLGAKYERVEIQDSDGDIEPRDELGNKLTADDSGEDDLLTIQFGVVNDRRNNPRTPTSGSLLRFGTEQSIPVGSGEIAFNRVRANYSLYFPIDLTNFAEGPEALAFNVQAGHILGDLPPYEAFPLGGTSTVRGYDEGELAAGRTFLLGTVEYRFPLFNFLGGALFIDAASVFDSQSSVIGNPGGVREKPGDGIGYGAGIRVQSPLGPIRIDYAVNDEGDTRFHFGIGEKF